MISLNRVLLFLVYQRHMYLESCVVIYFTIGVYEESYRCVKERPGSGHTHFFSKVI